MKLKLYIAFCLVILLNACDSKNDSPEPQSENNLEDIQITVDKKDVFLGEEVTFEITGRADYLTFFSGEPGNDYATNPDGGIEYNGKIDFLSYLFKEEGSYDVVFVAKNKNGDERVIDSFVINAIRDPNPPLLKKKINIGLAPASVEGETFLVDLANIQGNSMDQGASKQEEIDFLAFWSGTAETGYPVFFAPSGTITGWANGRTIDANWTTRNPGIYIRLNSPTNEELAQFEELATRDDLVEQFEILEQSIENRDDYVLLYNGPGDRINHRNASPEDIIYFKSEARNLYAAFKVSVISPTANGVIELDVKSVLEY